MFVLSYVSFRMNLIRKDLIDLLCFLINDGNDFVGRVVDLFTDFNYYLLILRFCSIEGVLLFCYFPVSVYFKFVCFVFFCCVVFYCVVIQHFYFVVCSGFFKFWVCINNSFEDVLFTVVNLFFVSHKNFFLG